MKFLFHDGKINFRQHEFQLMDTTELEKQFEKWKEENFKKIEKSPKKVEKKKKKKIKKKEKLKFEDTQGDPFLTQLRRNFCTNNKTNFLYTNTERKFPFWFDEDEKYFGKTIYNIKKIAFKSVENMKRGSFDILKDNNVRRIKYDDTKQLLKLVSYACLNTKKLINHEDLSTNNREQLTKEKEDKSRSICELSNRFDEKFGTEITFDELIKPPKIICPNPYLLCVNKIEF